MELAKTLFDIPLVVTPENMASPDLDELSGMTYLSYFMKLDSPGYNATLRWVQKQIPQKNISNFQVGVGPLKDYCLSTDVNYVLDEPQEKNENDRLCWW